MATSLAAAHSSSRCVHRSQCFRPVGSIRTIAMLQSNARSMAAPAASPPFGASPLAPAPQQAASCAKPFTRPQRQQRSLMCSAASGQDAGAEAEAGAAAEQRVRAAAKLVADTFLRDEIALGISSGAAVGYLLEELAQRLAAGRLRGVRCVPASDAAASEAAFHGVPLTTLQEAGRLDFFVQVADELAADPEANLAFIVGRQQKPAQPALHRARELAAAATTNIVIAEDAAVLVPRLGGTLPVAVQEEGWEETGEELDDVFLGDAELWRRSNDEGAGPRGGDSPYVSPEGQALIDIRFYEGLKLFGEDADYGAIAREIEGVEGVVAHGLMSNVAAAAVVAAPDGPRLTWRGEDPRG